MSATPRTETSGLSLTRAMKSLPRGGQDGADRLGEDDQAEAAPRAEAQRLGGLDLAGIDRLDARPEDLGDEGRIAERECKDRTPHEREIAREHRLQAEWDGEGVPGGHQRGRGDKGDVEKQDQHRHASHDLDVEARAVAQERGVRQRVDCEGRSKAAASAKAANVT